MTVKFVHDLIQRSRFRLLFLKTSNDFIFYPTVDFKSKALSNGFDDPMSILTPKNSINTPIIIQFNYKLVHPHPNSI